MIARSVSAISFQKRIDHLESIAFTPKPMEHFPIQCVSQAVFLAEVEEVCLVHFAAYQGRTMSERRCKLQQAGVGQGPYLTIPFGIDFDAVSIKDAAPRISLGQCVGQGSGGDIGVARIEDADPFAIRPFDGLVHGIVHPLVGLAVPVGQTFRKTANDVGCSIRRSAIKHEVLHLDTRLGQGTQDGFANVIPVIAYHSDDGHTWRHRPSSFLMRGNTSRFIMASVSECSPSMRRK